MLALPISPLEKKDFAPFGEVIEQPSRPSDASGPGWRWWGEEALLAGGDRPYALGYLSLAPAELKFNWAERHMRSDELLVPVSGSCLVYVGPPDFPDQPGRLPDLQRFRVFRVRQGQAVLLKPGVWHGAPLADGGPVQVVALLLKDSGSLDISLVRFPETPVAIYQP